MAEKKVDEGWKKQAQAEKERLAEGSDERAAGPPPQPTFAMLVSSLVAQTLIALGQIESPVDGKRSLDVDGAKFSIDLLQVLEDKTKGNLTPDEQKMLEDALYDLRMRYVEMSG